MGTGTQDGLYMQAAAEFGPAMSGSAKSLWLKILPEILKQLWWWRRTFQECAFAMTNSVRSKSILTFTN